MDDEQMDYSGQSIRVEYGKKLSGCPMCGQTRILTTNCYTIYTSHREGRRHEEKHVGCSYCHIVVIQSITPPKGVEITEPIGIDFDETPEKSKKANKTETKFTFTKVNKIAETKKKKSSKTRKK